MFMNLNGIFWLCMDNMGELLYKHDNGYVFQISYNKAYYSFMDT